MAQMELRYFGEISGKLGNVVFRRCNGKTIVARAPGSYKQPDTIEYKNRMARFKLSAKFTSTALKIDGLKQVWHRRYPGKNVFNLFKSLVYRYIEPADINSTAEISPRDGFGASFRTALLTEKLLTVYFHPLTDRSGLDPAVEKTIKLAAVMLLTGPLNPDLPPYQLYQFSSDNSVINLTAALTFSAKHLTGADGQFSNYITRKVFCTLISYNDYNDPVRASDTFCLEFSITPAE